MTHSTTRWACLAALGLLLVSSGCFRPKTSALALAPLSLPPGSLEFCIVANDVDDDDVFKVLQDEIDLGARDPKKKEALKKLAEEGKPPPDPQETPGIRFTFKGKDTTYRWVELDPNMVKDLRLFDSSEEGMANEMAQSRAEEVAQARAEAHVAIVYNLAGGGRLAIWSRDCVDQSLNPAERAKKAVDYFILVRNTLPGQEFTEAHLKDISPGVDPSSYRAIIMVTCNEEGAKRCHDLTNDNKPDNRRVRNMAILIQGKLFSMPTLQAVLTERFQISGDFTQEYVNEVVSRIRTAGK